MPSARELLEQADALMRRNRAPVIETEAPEPVGILPPAAPAAPPAIVAPPAAMGDVPELTDIVEEIEIRSLAERRESASAPPALPDADRGVADAQPARHGVDGSDADALAGAADPIAAMPSVLRKRAPVEEPLQVPPADAAIPDAAVAGVPAVERALPSESPPSATPPEDIVEVPAPPPGNAASTDAPAPPAAVLADPADDWARWQALADEIRMQVLQRIDIFTDAGLRKQLGAQLKPIVDRASVELVATINEQVGKLLRAYIAEAIEREIEKWRKGNG
jgi:hypothetical protein